MAEEARDPARDVPRSIGLVAAAVFAIYAFLPAVALSAMPIHETPALSNPPGTAGTHFWTALGGKYAGDPVQGIVQNLGLGALTTPVSYYVGLLAGTILIIATNAGLIGVSRLTYSMGVHRQFPDFLRTVHPTWRTPWVAIVVYTFAAIGMIGAAKLAGGQGVAFLGNLYAFGAMLSFTIAHASVIALRVRKGKRDPEQPFRAPLNIRIGELDIPLFAVLGGTGTFAAFIVVAALFPAVRWAGLGWLALGMVIYVVYRKRQGLPLTKTVLRRHQAARARDRDRVPHDRAPRDRSARRRRDDRDRAAARLGAARARRGDLHARGAGRAAARSGLARGRAARQRAAGRGRGARAGVRRAGHLAPRAHSQRRPRPGGGGAPARQRDHRARLARALGPLGAPVRLHGRLRAAARPLQGHGRRNAGMARRGARRRARGRRRAVTLRNRVALVLSAVLVVLGLTAIVRTAMAGGSGVAVGYVFGGALTLAGLGRGWLALHMARRE